MPSRGFLLRVDDLATLAYPGSILRELETVFMLRLGLALGLFLAADVASAQHGSPLAVAYFDWGKVEIRRDDRSALDKVAEDWKARPATRLLLSGHTDRSGDPVSNQATGMRRARSVAAELERRGIPRSAMRLVSFGEEAPLVVTEDGVREVQNRRVVISFEE